MSFLVESNNLAVSEGSKEEKYSVVCWKQPHADLVQCKKNICHERTCFTCAQSSKQKFPLVVLFDDFATRKSPERVKAKTDRWMMESPMKDRLTECYDRFLNIKKHEGPHHRCCESIHRFISRVVGKK